MYKNAPCELSSPRDNGKMNAKWRTQRHLSIRDLDWRSLFLSDSSFRAIDDHTGLARGAAAPRRRFFLLLLLLFFLFLSKRLHNNRPYCDHGAPLNLNYDAQKKFSCLRCLSRESLQPPITKYRY
ncbi:hypothetical protein P5V15_003783 [Pogonomyrmex californicus]